MASPTSDLAALWQVFLLGKYTSTFSDTRITEEERLSAQMELEGHILRNGPLMLREVQKSFNVSDEYLAGMTHLQEWFVGFVSTLNSDWLEEAKIDTAVRFWSSLEGTRSHRAATELIARIEWTNDVIGRNAPQSELVKIFRKSQPDPLGAILSDRAKLIFEVLLLRAKLTPISLVKQPGGSLPRYCIRVVRFCFSKPYERLDASQIDLIVKLAGELTPELQDYFRSVLTDLN